MEGEPTQGDKLFADRNTWQASASDEPARDWEVIVVGAGPAGSTLARCLASRGREVLLLDRHSFPRDKVCGDALIPDALGVLRRSGLFDEVASAGHRVDTVSVFSPSRIEVRVPGECMTLKRRTLDALLARAATRAGAVLRTGIVESLDSNKDGRVQVRIRGGEPQRARITVLAVGAQVDLLNRLGMVTDAQPSALAVRCYIRSEAQFDSLMISYDKRLLPGYGWIFPMGGGEYNVGCGEFLPRPKNHNLKDLLSRFLDSFPLARDLMARGGEMGEVQGAPLRCGLTGSAVAGPGGILAIGESIGATFPFTGEGIGKAMETAEIAAAAIDQALDAGSYETLKELPKVLDRELAPKYRAYQVAQRWISHAWVNDLVAWRANRSPYMQQALRDMLADRADASRIFSARGFTRSLMG